MFWKKKSKADQVSSFVGSHVKSWSMAAAMDGLLSGGSPADGPAKIASAEFDRLILNATIYGAADSFGQSIGASDSETAEGIKKHLAPYSDANDVYEQIIICGNMPELAEAVTYAGQCVYEIRARQADPTQQYLQLFKKLRERFTSR